MWFDLWSGVMIKTCEGVNLLYAWAPAVRVGWMCVGAGNTFAGILDSNWCGLSLTAVIMKQFWDAQLLVSKCLSTASARKWRFPCQSQSYWSLFSPTFFFLHFSDNFPSSCLILMWLQSMGRACPWCFSLCACVLFTAVKPAWRMSIVLVFFMLFYKFLISQIFFLPNLSQVNIVCLSVYTVCTGCFQSFSWSSCL